jgi:hypothetical protein
VARATPPAAQTTPPAAKTGAPPKATPGPADEPEVEEVKSSMTAEVAEVPRMQGGPMVDPSAWFSESGPHEAGAPSDARPLPPPPVSARRDSLKPMAIPPLTLEEPIEGETPAPGRLPGSEGGDSLTPPFGIREPGMGRGRSPLVEEPTRPSTPARKTAAGVRGSTPKSTATVPAQPPGDAKAADPDATPPAGVRLPPAGTTPPVTQTPMPATRTPEPAMRTPEPATARASISKPNPLVPASATPPVTAAPTAATRMGVAPSAAIPAAAAQPAAPSPVIAPRAQPSAPTDEMEAAPTTPLIPETSAALLPPPPAPTTPPEPVPRALRDPDMLAPAAMRTRPRPVVLAAAGGVVLLLLLLGLTFGLRHRSGPRAPETPRAPVVATPTPSPAPPAPAAPSEPPPSEPTPAPAAETAPPVAPSAPAAAEAPHTRRTLGGKKVVLEYDPKPTSPAPPEAQANTPKGEDPAIVAKARDAYHRGNVRLFAGDAQGAIGLYHEALHVYPGYVAGYRGLGLAYEAAGKPADALQAFRTYVRTVPNANDVSLVKKRIDRLEAAQ